MLKKASGRAAAAMGCGGDPPAPSCPTPKLTDGGTGTGTGRPASRLLSTRSFPSLFTDSAAMSAASVSVAELSRNAPCSSGGRNGSARSVGIGGSAAAAGLAGVLVAEEEEEAERGSCKNNRRVLLGMRLRVQLPPPTGRGPGGGGGGGGGDLPGSPIEFGVKNRDAQLALLSPVQRSPLSSAAARLARRSEVEEFAGEDYTCVIARGPNPKMTHIFEDRVVESPADAGAGAGGGGGGGGGDACCFLPSSCSGCKDAALLLPRGEKELCSNHQWNEGLLFGERAIGSLDSSVKLKP
ncbi:hypothetical protein BDA96_02G049400 [Sorghum bicolor]|uniref:FLZ-type domain-containing protein n=1 Tax=Sorghum bicolor TaxID=4558 RepID=A0A921RLA0_SORBI|nr:hypothetical protein BDA96_02G049400 [Sorghum bicolor]